MENENLEKELEEAMRLHAIDQLSKEGDLEPLEFTSYEEANLIEDAYVDEEVDYNEVDLDNFL